MGVGRWFTRDAGNAAPPPSGPPTPANPTNLAAITLTGGAITTYEILTGVGAVNNTRAEGTEFDNRGTLALGGASVSRYPNLILQARAGDSITFLLRVAKSSAPDNEYVRGWVSYDSGVTWNVIGTANNNTTTPADFTFNYTIPAGTANGNYALAFANNYSVAAAASPTSTEQYKSLSAYSLEIW